MDDALQEDTPRSIPDFYLCAVCGAKQCKLWKNPSFKGLQCIVCLTNYFGISLRDIGEDGTRICTLNHTECRIWNLGAYYPAILDSHEKYVATGHHTKSQAQWWMSLPNVP